MPPNEPCPHCGQLILDWHNEWYGAAERRAIYGVPIREPACANLAGYIANHSAGQQYSGYWQPNEVQQADQQVAKP